MPASAAKQLIHRESISKRLLAHYDAHARSLPWRSPPGEPAPEPYVVWLSEVMLQQTTVATVKPRFRQFIKRWPTIDALAAASDEDILSEWAGLGYYARARNLIACARKVVRRGGFPMAEAELRALPGLGEYTAAAIAAIAFGERATVIDTNVARVVARIGGVVGSLAGSRGEIRKLAKAMTPSDRPGDYAQAMMDLGATICRPSRPDCGICPLAAECAAYASGTPESFPAPKIRHGRPHRHGIAWWVERDNCIWLTRRPAKGLLGGMAALPGPEWSVEPPAGPFIATIKHCFTHFTLDLHIARTDEAKGEGWWQPLDEIAEAGLPTLYAKAVEASLGARFNVAA